MRRNTTHLEQRTRSLFDRWARWYDGPLARLYFEPLYRKVLTLTKEIGSPRLKPGALVLDVACGTGELILRLASDLPKVRFIGLDLAPAMIERARAKSTGIANVSFQVRTARRLPLADASVDLLLCTEAFHHFAEPDRVLTEFQRVLALDGHLILVDPGAPSPLLTRLIALVARLFELNEHVYSQGELVTLLESASFTVMSWSFAQFNNFLVATRVD